MKSARVFFGGAVHEATEAAGSATTSAGQASLRLADGRVVDEQQVMWLAPFEPRTIFALALNYADHAQELAAKSSAEQGTFLQAQRSEPVVFLKGANSVVGHRGLTRRPADGEFMHYECELAVVIGREGKRIARSRALDFVRGYTVANDYAIRNFLEPYYRPNLRVKSRDRCTPLGPWLVDAADVPDPMALDLSTTVNGTTVQRGNTRDMVFDIPALIAYLSSFMTLSAGDVILTGTPEGVGPIARGDTLDACIQGIGAMQVAVR